MYLFRPPMHFWVSLYDSPFCYYVNADWHGDPVPSKFLFNLFSLFYMFVNPFIPPTRGSTNFLQGGRHSTTPPLKAPLEKNNIEKY